MPKDFKIGMFLGLVLVIGAAYKPDVDDIRESPSLDIIGLLRQKGAKVNYHDLYIPRISHDDWSLESVPNLIESAQNSDCAVIVTDHSDYDFENILERAPLIIDTRNALGKAGKEDLRVVRL